MNMRKCFLLLIVFALFSVTYAFSPARINIDKKSIHFQLHNPFIDKKDRVLVPVREMGKHLGYNVDYHHAKKQIRLQKGKEIIVFTINQKQYTHNGVKKHMDTTPILQKGKAYIPIRYVSIDFGYHIQYKKDGKVVYLTSPKEKEKPVSSPKDKEKVDTEKPTTPTPENPKPIPPPPTTPTPENPKPTPPPPPPTLAANQEEIILPNEKEMNGCYVIRTVGQLQAMKEDLNGCYLLGNDIDASYTTKWNNGEGFEPVGDLTNPFRGSIDGQGFTITDLFINRPSEQRVGLVNLYGGEIKNLSIENANVTGGTNLTSKEDLDVINDDYSFTGSLAGFAQESKVENIIINQSAVHGNDVVGSLIGATVETSLKDISVDSFRVQAVNFAGGVIGADIYSSTIQNIVITDGIVEASYASGGLSSILQSSVVQQIEAKDMMVETKDPVEYPFNVTGGLFAYDIGYSKISDITLQRIHVKGNESAGGLASDLYNTTIENILVEEVDAEATYYAGGLFAFDWEASKIHEIDIQNTLVKGEIAGGIAGQITKTTISNSDVKNIQVEGMVDGGGLFGIDGGMSTITENTIVDSFVIAPRAGGMASKMEETVVSDVTLNGIDVQGDTYGGGLFVYDVNDSSIQNVFIQNSTIHSNKYGGGMASQLSNTTVEHVTLKEIQVEALSHGGGLFAFDLQNSLIRDTQIQETVIKSDKYAGGMAASTNGTTVERVSLIGVHVDAVELAGGLFAFDSKNSKIRNTTVQNTTVKAFEAGGLAARIQQTIVNGAMMTDIEITADNQAGGVFVIDNGGSSMTDASLLRVNVTSKKQASGIIISAKNTNLLRIILDSVSVTGTQEASGIVIKAENSVFEDISGENTSIQSDGTISPIIKTDIAGNIFTNINVLP